MKLTVENLQEEIYTCYLLRKVTDENLQHNQNCLKTDSNTKYDNKYKVTWSSGKKYTCVY